MSVIGHSPILGVNNQNPPPPPTVSGPDTLTVGDPENASGEYTASDGTPPYSWSAPGLDISGTGDTVEITATVPGEYTVTVTDEDGVSSNGFTVTVGSVIELTGPEHIILDGSTGSASYSATGSEAGYTWDTENFPTGTTEGEDSIQLTVNQGGTFNVTAYGTVNGASVPSAPISVEVLGFEIEGPIRLSASEPPESLGYSLNGTYSNPSDFSWTTSHADIALMNPQNGDVSDLVPSPASATTVVTITATHEPSGATATKSVEFVKIDIEGPSPVVAGAVNTYTYTATTENYTVRLGANTGAMSSGTGIGVISAQANYGPTSHDIVAWLVLDTSITARKTVQINAPESPPGEDPDGNDDDDDDPTPPPPTPTPTTSPTPTPTPSPTPGSTPTPTPSPTPGSSPTPTPGSSPTPDPSPTPGSTPTPTPSPSPTPTPTPTPTPVPLPTPEQPILVYEVVSGYQVKYGMPPFATPTPAEPTAEAPKRYLKLNASTSLEGGCPETPVGGTIERIIDPLDGSETENVTGNPSYYGVKGDAQSPTSYSGSFEVSSYDDPPNREGDCPGDMTVNATLSDEHTTEMLYDEVLEKIGDYYDQWTETPRSAYLDLSEDELTLFVQNLRYRWVFPDNDETYTVSWLEVFEPEDDPETEDVDESQEYVIVSKTKTHQGATSEDDDFYIYPLERNERRDGRYFLMPVDIAVDANRDGIVNHLDRVGATDWTTARGATFIPNLDNDGGPRQRPGDGNYPDAVWINSDGSFVHEDWQIENEADMQDIAPIHISPMPNLPADYQVFLVAGELEDVQRMHVYPKIAANEIAIWGRATTETAPEHPEFGPLTDGVDLNITRIVNENSEDFVETREPGELNGDFILGLEGLIFKNSLPSITFDGIVDLTLEIRNASGEKVGGAAVQLGVAPWIIATREGTSETAYAIQHDQAISNIPGLKKVAADKGQFLQDDLQVGYTQMPGGPLTKMGLMMPRLTYNDGLSQVDWPRKELLGDDFGIFQLAGDFGGGGLDHGGNLQTLPATDSQRLGSIICGAEMHSKLKQFFVEQGVQDVLELGPRITLVGHIDELVNVLGDGRVAYADPEAAYTALVGLTEAEREVAVFFDSSTVPPASGLVSEPIEGNSSWFKTNFEYEGLPSGWLSQFKYVRFVDGEGQGIVGRISSGRESSSGKLEIEISELWITPSIITGSYPSSSTEHFPQSRPAQGDKFLLIGDSKLANAQGCPVVISVNEVLSDSAFWQANVEVKQEVVAIKSDLPGSHIGLPVLFRESGIFYTAFTPNLVNFQVVNGANHFPKQFGPKNASGLDVLESKAMEVMNVAQMELHDVWEIYHIFDGEVHCGTVVVRSGTDSWWDQLTE